MDFLRLPVEIGSKIFNYLDTKTQINVYNGCKELRSYLVSWCRLKKVVLSRSTLATVKTLDSQIFADLGEFITELNLSGVSDLTVDNLKPHIKRFSNLKSLDITFTNIFLEDISEICPRSLTNIGINFFRSFKNYNGDTNRSVEEVFRETQFDAIHFVVMELHLSAAPLRFLSGVHPIKTITITIADNYKEFLNVYHEEHDSDVTKQIEINFNKLTLTAIDCAVTHKTSKQLEGVTSLNFKQLEYIFMMYLEKIEIYVSPLLAKIFTVSCSDLEVEVCSYLPSNFMLDGNIVFLAWNKETTCFDDDFFRNLLVDLKDYFPTYYCLHNNVCMKVIDAPSSWFCIDRCDNLEKVLNMPDKLTLTAFCRRDGAIVRYRRPISLPKCCKPMQHLTFLRLNNIPIRNVFFAVLFEQCPYLLTLDLYMENQGTIRGYTQSLAKSIHLAKLKNFRLTSEDVQYDIIFGFLCGCPTLENVYICEYEREVDDGFVNTKNIVFFIEKCVNLYSLFIAADMSPEQLTMMTSPLRTTAQKLDRNYISIEVCQYNWGWNPFANVFCPSPLQIFN